MLSDAAVRHFNLHSAGKPEPCVVVISHDCDVVNDDLDKEPQVEVIVGQLIGEANGNWTSGKSSRTLHCQVNRGGIGQWVELVSTDKRCIPKQELARFSPDDSYSIDGKTLATLRSWLAKRYGRAAFPDTFNRRMHDTGADSALAKTLEKHGKYISFVYFKLGDKRTVECQDDEQYELDIVLVYPPGDDPLATADQADAIADAVESRVLDRLKPGCGIKLNQCFSASEDELKVSEAKLLDEWDLAYLTFRASEEQPARPAF